jgi:hypothetical protein
MIFGTLQLLESWIEDGEIEQGRQNIKKWGDAGDDLISVAS